jgi:UDP-glucose 4-epimerase
VQEDCAPLDRPRDESRAAPGAARTPRGALDYELDARLEVQLSARRREALDDAAPQRPRQGAGAVLYNGPMAPRHARPAGLTVAVTGPTGEIGQAVVAALERAREVGRVRGMARRAFDPASRGWRKVSYQRGDVLDRRAVAELVRGADVVVHLAFIIIGGARESRAVNLDGSRNVFEATVAAGAERLVYASSVAAYGFHRKAQQPLAEEAPARGSAEHDYSAQKAEAEALLREVLDGGSTAAYVLRPCIVGGRDAPLLIDSLPYTQISERLPKPVRRLLGGVPILKPVLPDPGVPFQLVHHDDVARAMRAAVLGRGVPGAYNLAGPGELTVAELARELGWYSIPVPELAVDAVAELVGRLGFLPARAQWVSALREPVIMDTAKARRELRWRPKYDALQTLRETIAAARMGSLIR